MIMMMMPEAITVEIVTVIIDAGVVVAVVAVGVVVPLDAVVEDRH